MSTLATSLTTTAKVKTYLGISDSASDAVIDMLVDQASIFIEDYCGGRKFLNQSYADVIDSKGGNKVFLNQYPITALTKVEYRSGTPSTPIWNTFNVDSYLLYDKAGYIGFFGELPQTMQGLKVTYTAGYLIDFAHENTATHNLPNDLVMACTMLVASYVTNRQAHGISKLRTEGQEVVFDPTHDEMPAQVKTILGQYQAFRYAV